MIVTLTDFKSGVDHYLQVVDKEEIIITNDGVIVATLMPPAKSKAAIIRSLRGSLPSTATVDEAREERLAKHENSL